LSTEQLLPCEVRLDANSFISVSMANKPEKYGLNFWLAVDVKKQIFIQCLSLQEKMT